MGFFNFCKKSESFADRFYTHLEPYRVKGGSFTTDYETLEKCRSDYKVLTRKADSWAIDQCIEELVPLLPKYLIKVDCDGDYCVTSLHYGKKKLEGDDFKHRQRELPRYTHVAEFSTEEEARACVKRLKANPAGTTILVDDE